LRSIGFDGTSEEALLTAIETCCDARLPVLEPSSAQLVLDMPVAAGNRASKKMDEVWMTLPMSSHVRQVQEQSSVAAAGDGSQPLSRASIEAAISAAQTTDEVTSVVCHALRGRLSKMMGINIKDIDLRGPMVIHGMDPLAAIEMRTWVSHVLAAEVTVFEILGNAPLESLGLAIAKRTKFAAAQA
jgi:hypothetical protein